MYRKYYLWFECIAIFLVIPLLLWMRLVSIPLILIPVFIICLPATFWLARKYGLSRNIFWSGDEQAERRQLSIIVRRFLLISVLLLSILYVVYPAHLFDMPRQAPMLWLGLMVLYPLLSVYPQELLYRTFFFRRYSSLFTQQRHLLLANALLFGWMHIVFHNGLAVLYTVLGGYLFADTYHKSGSLRLSCLEHALYGNLIFTIGYGQAFLFEAWFRQFNAFANAMSG